ncbi:MAG TPA: hypothetical protein PKY87_05335 [Terricaulis sp.]|jgi:hypothetical protein|nr:hypothetical protein [Terricaulis sp.]
MASTLAPKPSLSAFPPTLEAVASFRMKTAALMRPADPRRADPDVIVVTNARGEVVAYPPSEKLIILAARRSKTETPDFDFSAAG